MTQQDSSGKEPVNASKKGILLLFGQDLKERVDEERAESLRIERNEDEEDDRNAALLVLPCLYLISSLLIARENVLEARRVGNKDGQDAAEQALIDAITSIDTFSTYDANTTFRDKFGWYQDGHNSNSTYLTFASRHTEWALLLKMLNLLRERHSDTASGLVDNADSDVVTWFCSTTLSPIFASLGSSLRAVQYAREHIFTMLMPSLATSPVVVCQSDNDSDTLIDGGQELEKLEKERNLSCFETVTTLMDVVPAQLESFHCEMLLHPPSSLLLGELLHGDLFHHNKAGLIRRFELLTYSQELLHDLIFVCGQPSEAIEAKDYEGERNEDKDVSKNSENLGINDYFKTLEKKKRIEDLIAHESTVDDGDESTPGISYLRNVILTLQATA